MQINIFIAIALVITAAVLTFVGVKLLDRLRRRDAETEAREIIALADRESANRRKEAELEIKEMAIQQKAEGERELAKLRHELHERERLLDKRQDTLEQQHEQLHRQEKMVETSQRKLAEKIEDTNRRNEELASVLDVQRQTLHALSGLSREDATARLLEMLERDLTHEAGALILKHEKKMAEIVEAKSRDILLTCIQRYAATHTAETTTSTVDIPSDEMKGRIIGREGRNIRAFEKATGVDVIIDDTPGVVIVSAFDTVRREVARLALNKLIADGRIHPARIEELVAETQTELEQHIQKRGEEAAQEADIPGLHPKIIHLLGRLRFRTSYSQNVLRHSIEVAFLSGLLAEEMGLDAPAWRGAADCCTTSAKRPTTRPKVGTRRSAPSCSSATAKDRKWSMRRWGITTTSASIIRTPCWWPRPMLAVLRVPEHAARRWSGTSSGWKSSRKSPRISKGSIRRSPFRRDANSACWSAPRTRRMPRPRKSAATLPTRSKNN